MIKKNTLCRGFFARLAAVALVAAVALAVSGAFAADAYMGTGPGGERVMGTGPGNEQIFASEPGGGARTMTTPPRPDVNSYDQRYNFAPEYTMDINWWTLPKPLPGPTPKRYDGVSPSTNTLPGVTGAPGRHPSAARDLPPPRPASGSEAARPTPGRLPDHYSRPMPGSIPGAGSRPSPGALPGQGY